MRPCIACDKGYYQDMEGQRACLQCGANQTTTAVGSNSSMQCGGIQRASRATSGHIVQNQQCWMAGYTETFKIKRSRLFSRGPFLLEADVLFCHAIQNERFYNK